MICDTVEYHALINIILMEIHNRLAEISERKIKSRVPRFKWWLLKNGDLKFTFASQGRDKMHYETTAE